MSSIYYISLIAMLFGLPNEKPIEVFERSVTGPFKTEEQCETYKLYVEEVVKESVNVNLVISKCKLRKLEI